MRAGFRVISLKWNTEYTAYPTARAHCLNELGFQPGPELPSDDERDAWADATAVDDLALNDCLVETREGKSHDPTTGMVPQLLSVLQHLHELDPEAGWGGYLTEGDTGPQPLWSSIVQAGYSEGANQTAYMLRHHDYYGNILISGGGDTGVIDLQRFDPIPLAGWMVPQHEDYRRVALSDDGETYDYNRGWTTSGLPLADRITTDAPPFYEGYAGASRLRNQCDCSTHEQAHASTVQADLVGAHMYLACKAGL